MAPGGRGHSAGGGGLAGVGGGGAGSRGSDGADGGAAGGGAAWRCRVPAAEVVEKAGG